MIGLLLSAMVWAFASAPTRECQSSAECVLVRDTYCQEILAIRIGQDADWAKWEAKERKRQEKEKVVCKAREQIDLRLLEAKCEGGLCVVGKKALATDGKTKK